jgi:hypothetical protein
MKQIIAAVALLLVLGLAGFAYRYEIEQPAKTPPSTPSGTVCTTEARICPDGSAVGKSGPKCTFAACPFPNVETTVGSITLAFVLPGGYAADEHATGADPELVGAFIKPSSTQSPHTIVIRAFPIPEGQKASEVMLAHTQLEPTGETATSTTAFKTVTIGGKSFYAITLERSPQMIHTAYYFYGPYHVLRFESIEYDVKNWDDKSLVLSTLPEQQALQRMLTTLQTQ